MVLVFTLAISGSVAVTSSETDADSIDYVYEINNIEFNGILYGEEHPTGVPGSIDLTDLEKYFTVKVSRTPVNSDGTLGVKEADVTLTADGFYLSVGGGVVDSDTKSITVNVPTRGGDLYQDVETVSRAVEVKLGSVSDVTVDYISVSTDDATIYDSTTEEEIKSHLTVTAYYSDDISHTVSDYDVYVTRSDGNATILIQYGETDNPNNQQTVSLKLGSNNISKVERIVLDNGYVESYYDENDLKHAMDVIVSRTDNKLHYLEDYNVTAEVPCHVGSDIPVVPYYRPGSKELAEGVISALKDHNSVLLKKHGQVVCGKDFDEAFERAMFFEMACRIIILTGGKYETLTNAEIDDLETYVLGKKTK